MNTLKCLKKHYFIQYEKILSLLLFRLFVLLHMFDSDDCRMEMGRWAMEFACRSSLGR
jgi:hypothetical protein